ncbi:MAG: hypothetical protein ACPGYL_05285, partial [Rhodospirillaceae bacterium]
PTGQAPHPPLTFSGAHPASDARFFLLEDRPDPPDKSLKNQSDFAPDQDSLATTAYTGEKHKRGEHNAWKLN